VSFFNYDYYRIDEVSTNLWITGMCAEGLWTLYDQVDKVAEHKFDAILNCADFDLPVGLTNSIEDYAKLGIYDGERIPDGVVAKAVTFLEQTHGKGKRVLVHCAAGISRSVGMTAAYLAKKNKTTLHAAINSIAVNRSCANPHFAIQTSIELYLREVRRPSGPLI